MAQFNWHKDYYHKDPWYGFNDWDAVVAYVRALMEDSEVDWCWPHAKMLILADNSLLSQVMVGHLGEMRDARSLDIIAEKLEQLGSDDRAIISPWEPQEKYYELLCLEALAKIGGPKVRSIVEKYRKDPAKSYLADGIEKLDIAAAPRQTAVEHGDEFPKILRGIHSINDVLRIDQEDAEYQTGLADVLYGSKCLQEISAKGAAKHAKEQKEEIVKAWRSLKWPGPIEYISGDGSTTIFKLKNKITSHIHDVADPYSDFGIFLSDPKIEYPIGRRRWAVSHTFLFFQVPDGSVYGREYTYDVEKNTITTHFHEHVALEEVTVNPDGKSITVSQKPISTGVETRGNTFSRKCNSSVRGVWDNPQRQGKNYYIRRANELTPYRNLCYFSLAHEPLVNIWGAWLVEESERPERFFDTNGSCIDVEGVIEELLIPLHEPKVLTAGRLQYVPDGCQDRFGSRLPKKLWPELTPVPPASVVDPYMGAHFEPHRCGVAGWEQNNNNGYRLWYDINSDGVVDQRDKEILAQHAGEVYRKNLFTLSYFGINWVATSYGSRSKNFLEDPPIYICSYDYGAGYNSDNGCVNLFEKVAPGKKLYVEYFYDAPAREGKNNIKVYLHEEI